MPQNMQYAQYRKTKANSQITFALKAHPSQSGTVTTWSTVPATTTSGAESGAGTGVKSDVAAVTVPTKPVASSTRN